MRCLEYEICQEPAMLSSRVGHLHSHNQKQKGVSGRLQLCASPLDIQSVTLVTFNVHRIFEYLIL